MFSSSTGKVVPEVEGHDQTPGTATMSVNFGRLFPKPSILSPWILSLPAIAVVGAPAVHWGLEPSAATLTHLLAVLASLLVIAVGLVGVAKVPIAVPHWLVMTLAPVLFVGLGLIQQNLAAAISQFVGASVESDPTSELLTAGVWVVLGYCSWYLVGVHMRSRVHRVRLAQVIDSLGSVSDYQRNRIRAELRTVLRDLASRLDRVVQEMTIEQAGSDQALARTMPHRDELADQLVEAIENRIYRSVAAEAIPARPPWWQRVEPAHPVFLPAVLLAVIALVDTTQLISAVGFVLLALLATAIGHAVLRHLGATMQPSLTRLAAMAGGSVLIAAGVSVLLASTFALGGTLSQWLVWVVVMALTVFGGAWATAEKIATDRQEDADWWARERVRECVQLAIRYDTLSGTNARSLYSATLGTLIFASVDLTNTRSKPGSREAALETMASRIVSELQIRVSQREPLPEELIRLVVAVWQSVASVTVSFRQEVFSRFSWADESIRRLQHTLGDIVIDAIATASTPVAVSLREHDQRLEATVRLHSDFGVRHTPSTTTDDGGFVFSHTLEATPLTKTPLRSPEEVFAS